MQVIAICKDRDGHTLGARIRSTDADDTVYYTEQLKQLFIQYGSAVFSNAILTKDGFVRAKRGSKLGIETHTVSTTKTKSITVYHGSPNKTFTPQYGLGDDKHDYGKGFYTTQHEQLAKEWAVCLGNDGYLHTYNLDLTGLTVLNFDELSPLCWLAELMKHRDADTSARYKRFAPEFIRKFGVNTNGYDIIIGWRADSSYFQVAKRFVRNEFDYELISDLLKLGDLKQQVCVKSARAYAQLHECSKPKLVSHAKYYPMYAKRDNAARQQMQQLIESKRNTMTHGFDYVMREVTL